MADTNLPQVPSEVDPNDRHVEFKMCECRQCGERSDWVRIERDEHGKVKAHPALWHHEHIAEHGRAHVRFYEYTFTRNTGETWIPRSFAPQTKGDR